MIEKVLSILIPTTYDREEVLSRLLYTLNNQIFACRAVNMVEILIECDNKELPTGTKRNILLVKSKGRYVVSIDSDDEVPTYYIEEILKAAEYDSDCMGINGIMTTNGGDEKRWFIAKDNPYVASRDENGKEIYLRYQNHISPIKRSIAIQFKFPDVYQGEDYSWATAIHESGLIKTETKIEKPMYHYKFMTHKK